MADPEEELTALIATLITEAANDQFSVDTLDAIVSLKGFISKRYTVVSGPGTYLGEVVTVVPDYTPPTKPQARLRALPSWVEGLKE